MPAIRAIGDRVFVHLRPDMYKPDEAEQVARKMLAEVHRARYMQTQFERRRTEFPRCFRCDGVGCLECLPAPEGATVGEVRTEC